VSEDKMSHKGGVVIRVPVEYVNLCEPMWATDC